MTVTTNAFRFTRRSARFGLMALVLAFLAGIGARAQNAGSSGAPAIPRTANGKPDLTGTYQWPTYLQGDERGRSSATVFDRKRFAPFKPGGEAVLEHQLRHHPHTH